MSDKCPLTVGTEPCGFELFEEMAASSALFASEGGFKSRVRIVMHDGSGCCILLPRHEWLLGRVLGALRSLILMAMPKALIVSLQDCDATEHWVVARGEADGIRHVYRLEPEFGLVASEKIAGVENAPRLVQYVAQATRPGTRADFSDANCFVAYIIDVLGVDGDSPLIPCGGFDLLTAIGAVRMMASVGADA